MLNPPAPLTIEQAAHLLKLACTPYEIGVLRSLFDALFDTLTELDVLDAYITEPTKSELTIFAAAINTVINEPMTTYKDEVFVIVTPEPLPPLVIPPLSDDDDLNWLDRFLPSDL